MHYFFCFKCRACEKVSKDGTRGQNLVPLIVRACAVRALALLHMDRIIHNISTPCTLLEGSTQNKTPVLAPVDPEKQSS